MFKEKPSRGEKPMSVALIELYDELREFTDYCFFLCDALDGMLSPDLALEPETVNGIRISTDWMKCRSRRIAQQLRDICDQSRQGD